MLRNRLHIGRVERSEVVETTSDEDVFLFYSLSFPFYSLGFPL